MKHENIQLLSSLGEPLIPMWQFGKVTAYGKSDVGCVRESNQDNYIIADKCGLFMVADGMGGLAGGEIASELAVTTVQKEFEAQLSEIISADIIDRRSKIAHIINTASLHIYEHALELPLEYREMGTTAVLIWIPPTELDNSKHKSIAIVANVGDSRCYLQRAGMLYQVSEDHSQVHEQIKSGKERSSIAIAHLKNVITRCVGYQENEEVDTFEVQLFENDRFLLCSDGLSNKVTDIEICEFLCRKDLHNVVDDLILLAKERGGEDNITCVIVHVEHT